MKYMINDIMTLSFKYNEKETFFHIKYNEFKADRFGIMNKIESFIQDIIGYKKDLNRSTKLDESSIDYQTFLLSNYKFLKRAGRKCVNELLIPDLTSHFKKMRVKYKIKVSAVTHDTSVTITFKDPKYNLERIITIPYISLLTEYIFDPEKFRNNLMSIVSIYTPWMS